MSTPFPLFDEGHLSSLIGELRRSMRSLLMQLCDDLDGSYRQVSRTLQIPVEFFRMVGATLGADAFSHWKVVGWIEELNELVYLLDVREQFIRESDQRGFAEAFFAACTPQYYEHSYFDELFPKGRPLVSDLARRLTDLCTRLTEQVIREAWFLAPGLPCRWLEETGQRHWTVPYDLGPNFERAEPANGIALGLDGARLASPVSGHQPRRPYRLVIYPDKIALKLKGRLVPILVLDAARQWRGRLETPSLIAGRHIRTTIGHTLVYGKDRTPIGMTSSSTKLAAHLEAACHSIETVWPEGARNVGLLTSRIIPLRASGVVSFSYRHRPGLSFINCFDRDQFDLIDDLIHENSHHQLNLYLRKDDLLHGEHTEEIFYSPWRRSLRPLRGILHATFTFTMGALLFDRLASSPTLTNVDRVRACARCFEEVESVTYSLRDLSFAARRLGWLSESGVELVRTLKREIDRVHRRIAPQRIALYASHHGRALTEHCRALRRARSHYGPNS